MTHKPETGIKKLDVVVDVSPLKTYIMSLNTHIWDDWKLRQTIYEVHQKTKSIKVLYNGEVNKQHYKIIFEHFKILEEIYNGKITRIIIVKLHSNSFIPLHVDSGYLLERAHRIHIPIITNDKCIFKCGKDEVNMKESFLYEINNQLSHSVVNDGPDRIHLIIDVLPFT
jgi:hypothetical protein